MTHFEQIILGQISHNGWHTIKNPTERCVWIQTTGQIIGLIHTQLQGGVQSELMANYCL